MRTDYLICKYGHSQFLCQRKFEKSKQTGVDGWKKKKRGGKKWEITFVDNSFTKFSCEREQKETWQKLRKGKRVSLKKEIKMSNGGKCKDKRLS